MVLGSVPLIDCHLHLADPALAGDLPGVLARASAVGIRYLICNGTCESDWPRVAELARTYPQVIPCFGLHPWYVSQRSGHWLAVLETFLDAMPSAIGEIGLDRWIEPRDEPAQEAVFREQLALARKRRIPLMVHCLRAWGWLLDVLETEAALPGGMLIHAYGGPVELIKPLAERGAYFSFAGNALEDRKVRAREALAAVPRDRLLIETDAPDMLPPLGYRPYTLQTPDGRQMNEPANLPTILGGLSGALRQSPGQLAQSVWENACRFLSGLIEERGQT